MSRQIHVLKTHPQYFVGVSNKTKPFELRVDDRKYQVNDLLVLKEWRPDIGAYTGQTAVRVITYKMNLNAFSGLKEYLVKAPDYCILGLRAAIWDEEAEAEAFIAAQPNTIHGESPRDDLPRSIRQNLCPSSLMGTEDGHY